VIITDESIAPIATHHRYTSHILSGSTDGAKTDNVACEKERNCSTFSIGWSSASIYTFVRPEFILSLQPAWFLNSLKFSIHEHVGFSREVTLHVSLRNRSLPVNTTEHEIKHSLEHATAKVISYAILNTVVSRKKVPWPWAVHLGGKNLHLKCSIIM
jgi:hypothetical protein